MAKRGIGVNQKALDIVGNNIANLGVTGYTRQRVDQVSISVNGMSNRYAANKAMLAGQGADVKGIAQLRDPYLDKRFRQENSDMGYYGKVSEILADVETSLDEYDSTGGLKGSIEKLSKALAALTGSGINATNANVVRTTAKSMTQVLRQFDTKLNNIIEQQSYDLEVSVQGINSVLERIANVNESISRTQFQFDPNTNTYYGPNELLDERNLLLDQLSQYGPIQITTNPDNTVDVKMDGHAVVSGKKAETMQYVKNADNTVSVTWQSTGKDVAFSTGIVRAATDMINGRGPKATGNENYERGVPYYKDQIDSFAKGLADTMNGTIPIFDENKQPVLDASGKPTYKTLFTFDATKSAGAGSINIVDAWNDSADYLLVANNPAGVQDNTYFLNIVKLLGEDASIKFDNGFTGGFNAFVKDYTTTLGEDKSFHDSRLDASGIIAESVLDSISQVSGVSMDEEGADMMAYQKAYAAMSRIMTTLDEALDTLINRTGRVGL